MPKDITISIADSQWSKVEPLLRHKGLLNGKTEVTSISSTEDYLSAVVSDHLRAEFSAAFYGPEDDKYDPSKTVDTSSTADAGNLSGLSRNHALIAILEATLGDVEAKGRDTSEGVFANVREIVDELKEEEGFSTEADNAAGSDPFEKIAPADSDADDILRNGPDLIRRAAEYLENEAEDGLSQGLRDLLQQETRANAVFFNFVKNVLDDDNGVSGNTYDALLSVAVALADPRLKQLLDKVEATDGRFYLPQDDSA
jgi:hypothetical protein